MRNNKKTNLEKQDQRLHVLIKKLWSNINLTRKSQFLVLILMMIGTSALEVISVGSAIPFISVIVDPSKIYENELAKQFFGFINVENQKELVITLAIIFGVAALVASATKILTLWFQTKLSYAIGADISKDIYRSALYEDYEAFLEKNSSEVIAGIISKTNNLVFSVIIPGLNIVSSALIVAGLIVVLSWVDFRTTATVGLIFVTIYLLIGFTVKGKLISNGILVSKNQSLVVRKLQDGLASIRDIIIDGAQDFYINEYRNHDLELRKSQVNIQVISALPRYIIEAVGLIFIAIIACVWTLNGSGANANALTSLAVLALCAQKLLPIIQQIFFSWSSIRGGQSTLSDTLNLLRKTTYDVKKIRDVEFEINVRLNNVSYKYPGQQEYALKNVNINIPKGSRVGIVGRSGSGKSTLLDLIMGLLTPTSGHLEIDGKKISRDNVHAWRKMISHVPQSIYLQDASIEKNVTMGLQEVQINRAKFRESVRVAQIESLVNDLRDENRVLVGERGARISGGQRQRIGIARALYKDSELLILDEATSALDEENEGAITQALLSSANRKTILIVSHRPNALRMCDFIIRLEESGSVSVT